MDIILRKGLSLYASGVRVEESFQHLRIDVVSGSSKNRDLLGTFWDKLSEEEAKEILSFKDVTLEEVPGSSIIKSMMALIRKPGFSSLPQHCLRAGSALLDIIQARPSRFPLPSEELFSILDDASEKTFLCGSGTAVKAWLADKDAEALRCQQLLVEEEEAAQRRQAELLEKKRQKKLRQKEQKAKEQRQEEQADLKEWIDDTVETVSSTEQFPLIPSDSSVNGLEALPDHVPSSFEPFQLPSMDEDVDLEIQTGSGSDPGTSHNVERQAIQRNGRTKTWRMQKHGNHRDSKPVHSINGNRKWSRKPKPDYLVDSLKTRAQKEAISLPDHNKKHEVLIGSISVTLGNCSQHEVHNFDGARDDFLEQFPTSAGDTASRKLAVLMPSSKAFLAERWKEAIAAEHVKLVLCPDLESSECMEIKNDCLIGVAGSSDIKKCSLLGNVENQLVDVGVHESSITGASKAKIRTKSEKGSSKFKFIPFAKRPNGVARITSPSARMLWVLGNALRAAMNSLEKKMSGGVGPTCNDISLPKEQEQEQKIEEDVSSLKKGQNTTPSKKAGFLSFTQLNALSVITVLAASGMVSLEDFAFVVFSIIYMYFISKVAFPCANPSKDSLVFDPKNKILGLYVSVGAIIGLFLPIAYIFEGIFEGDKEGIKAAAPHVFLLASQVFMEGVAFSDRFALPVRVFVPVFYNSRRIFTIVEWLRNEISKVEQDYRGSLRRLHFGRALAVANMAFWCFNLFGFLLPVFLPRAFKKYYSGYKVKD
ncbi:hypothetical protein GH714_027511 [Hevea brasiliensis]|uniref:DUF7733 domain-containing protein n=1 Tax=Hevea brasiliensis TaxID=3981 RepID=A0A6A6N4T7_HEVBR|nr:hypothetical protein GH714_027511 [Hevea brasiliensis]